MHGYGRQVSFKFGAVTQDQCGFIVDFGDLKWLAAWLDHWFDHTLLLCADDPLLPEFQAMERAGACALRVMPYGVGMEGSAQFICEFADAELRRLTKGRAWVEEVECREHEKNSAVFINPQAGFRGWL